MIHIHNQVLPEGTQIGVHEIKDASNIGPFGITYRAWNHHLKGWVELQEYFPHDVAKRGDDGLGVEPKSAGDKENFEYGLKAFLDLAEILTQIEHPNIAVAENTLQFNGTAYLILDYQEGVPLSGLERSPASFTEGELKFILVSMLNALQKVHEFKIVHGGIQPETILLGKDGEPVLINFASARLAIASRSGNIASELRAGYSPAEQYELDNQPGPATDFYALGASMYHCITHGEPAAAQDRVMALSKGKPDPVVSLSGSPDSVYSEDLLETIDWMLCPDYNDRPQSVAEILAALKQEPTSKQAGSVASGQEVVDVDVGDGNAVATDRLWVGVMIGVAALTAIGLWFLQPGEKTSDLLDEKVRKVTAAASPQQDTGRDLAEQAKKDNEPVPVTAPESRQTPDHDKISKDIEKEIREPEKVPTQADSNTPPKSASGDKRVDHGLAANSKPVLEKAPAVKTEFDNEVARAPESKTTNTQSLAVVDKPLPPSKARVRPKIPADEASVKKYLASAELAYGEMRFTTPVGDNAYAYYQMVLAVDPDNEEALGGLQKMVDWYVQLIEKAKADGQPNTARVYLKRAEAVLPDAPNLKRLRAELTAPEDKEVVRE